MGLRIGTGFKRQMRERVGGRLGCTRLTEMMATMATTAVQVVLAIRREAGNTHAFAPAPPGRTHWIVDTCHAYRSDGDTVRLLQLARDSVSLDGEA